MYGLNNEQELFSEDMEENMKFLSSHIEDTSNEEFAGSLCSYYNRFGTLTPKQITVAIKFWREAKDANPYELS
jgi:hypothetical protein